MLHWSGYIRFIFIFKKSIIPNKTTNIISQKETKKLFKEGAFEKPYAKEQAKNHPLGENGVLAFGIKTGTDNNGNFSLEIQSESGKGMTFNLNDTLIYMFYSLLMQGIERSEWQIGRFPERTKKQLH